jgi:hypothetical protein
MSNRRCSHSNWLRGEDLPGLIARRSSPLLFLLIWFRSIINVLVLSRTMCFLRWKHALNASQGELRIEVIFVITTAVWADFAYVAYNEPP